MPTPRDLLNEAKSSIREVDPAGAQELFEGGGVTFLDVREPDEYEQGAIPNAVHLPRGHLEFQVEGKLCLLYTSPSPRDGLLSRMPSSA